MLTKYGTYVMFQHEVTKEVVEIPLSDVETLTKYAGDRDWRELGDIEPDYTPTKKSKSIEPTEG